MNDLLEGMIAYAREHSCSDIHLNVGGPAMIRANGVLREYPAFIKDTQTTEMILSMVDERLMEDFKQGKDLDFTYVSKGENRQRVNVYRQQDKLCAAIPVLPAVVNPRRWQLLWTISMNAETVIYLRLRIRWNTCISVSRRLFINGKSVGMWTALIQRFAVPCVRIRMSFW